MQLMKVKIHQDIPDFLLKSTLGLALASIVLLTPFGINNILHGRYLLAALTFFVITACTVNAWHCYTGKYNLPLNLFGISPLFTLAIAFVLYELGVVGSYWVYLGVLGFYFMLPEKPAWVMNAIFIAIILPVGWHVLDYSVAMRFSAVLIGISFFAFISMREITKQHNSLKSRAIRDTLTGLYNRSLLQSALEHAIQQHSRTGTVLSLIMFDIDHFKKINDQYGHDQGDSVLISLGSVLKDHFRGSDMVFRIGGEEFLVLMYDVNHLKAINIAERLRQKVESLRLIKDHTVTVSIGVAALKPDMDWKEWMKRCDENLYLAKTGGRNMIAA